MSKVPSTPSGYVAHGVRDERGVEAHRANEKGHLPRAAVLKIVERRQHAGQSRSEPLSIVLNVLSWRLTRGAWKGSNLPSAQHTVVAVVAAAR